VRGHILQDSLPPRALLALDTKLLGIHGATNCYTSSGAYLLSCHQEWRSVQVSDALATLHGTLYAKCA